MYQAFFKTFLVAPSYSRLSTDTIIKSLEQKQLTRHREAEAKTQSHYKSISEAKPEKCRHPGMVTQLTARNTINPVGAQLLQQIFRYLKRTKWDYPQAENLLIILPKCNFKRFCGFTITFIKDKLEVSSFSILKVPEQEIKRHGSCLPKAKKLLTVTDRISLVY